MSIELSPLNYRYQALPNAPEEVQEVARQDRYSHADGTLAERRPLNQRQVNYGGVVEARPPRIADKTLSKICNLTFINRLARDKTGLIIYLINHDLPQSSMFRKAIYGMLSLHISGPLLEVRTGLRIGVLLFRFLGFIAALVASAITGKSKFAEESGKLLGLTLIRFLLIPLQLLIIAVGSIVAIFTGGQLEHSFKLLRLAAEVDNYFDQWECSIDSAYEEDSRYYRPDSLIADQLFLPFRHPNPDIELERITNHLSPRVDPHAYPDMLQENREMVEQQAVVAPAPVFRNLHEMADSISRGKREHDLFQYQLVDGNGNAVPTPKPTIATCNAKGIIVRGDPVIDLPPEPPYRNPPEDDELELVSIA